MNKKYKKKLKNKYKKETKNLYFKKYEKSRACFVAQ